MAGRRYIYSPGPHSPPLGPFSQPPPDYTTSSSAASSTESSTSSGPSSPHEIPSSLPPHQPQRRTHDVVLDLFPDVDSSSSQRRSFDDQDRESGDFTSSTSDSYDSSGERDQFTQPHHRHHLTLSGDEGSASSRAASPVLREHWDYGPPAPDVMAFGRSVSRNRSRNPSGTTTPVSGAYDKEGQYDYSSTLYQTSALLRNLGGSLAPDNSPVLQHKKRKPDWWARRAETRRRSSFSTKGSAPSSPHISSKSGRNRSCLSMLGSALLRQPWVPTQPLTILFAFLLLGCFAATVTTFLVHVLSTDKHPLPYRTFCQEQRPFPHALADALAPTTVFVGVFTVDATYERRQLIRQSYMRHTRALDPATGRPAQNVQVKFILGRPREAHARRVALEMELYNDIVVLDLKENMNRGKTYAYFKWAAENATVPVYYTMKGKGGEKEVAVGFKKADYVVKADDDSFINLGELERHLRVTPREKTYWGYLIRNLFMAGEGYALSADLVQYVATYEPIKAYTTGAEDKRVSKWMRIHPQYSMINWVSERCWIYDHPKAGTTYSHGFLFPDEVERIRLEGRRGIDEEERIRRGGDLSQAYSTVTKWKTPYESPLPGLSIEEEVEALVEGGGRWATFRSDEGKGPESLKWDAVVFERNDSRIVSAHPPQLPDSIVVGVKPGVPERQTGLPTPRTTRYGKDLYRDPSDVDAVKIVKRGTVEEPEEIEVEVYNAVKAPLRDADDEEDKPWPAAFFTSSSSSSLASSTDPLPGSASSPATDSTTSSRSDPAISSTLPVTESPPTPDASSPSQSEAPSPTTPEDEPYKNEPTGQIRFPAHNYILPPSTNDRWVPPPTLRYDPVALALRERRMMGQVHGGTVMVHFLKRNEWFLETAIALLGKEKMWDQGVESFMYPATAREDPLPAEVESRTLARVPTYQGVGEVELVGAYWGGARQYGSPIVQSNGYVSPGRPAEAHREVIPNMGGMTSRLGNFRNLQ